MSDIKTKQKDILNTAKSCYKEVLPFILEKHYLKRKCPISYAFKLEKQGEIVGVVTFGTPPSRHMQKSVCPSNPSFVLELNRLWLEDSLPHGTASWFLSRVLKKLPPRLVASYADTSVGHGGGVYRAANFNYSGWTDQDRKTPRYDYVVEGKHSRDAFRSGNYTKVRRKPKVKYWIATGSKSEKKALIKICGWSSKVWDGGPKSLIV
jgi:hypothetical protein